MTDKFMGCVSSKRKKGGKKQKKNYIFDFLKGTTLPLIVRLRNEARKGGKTCGLK